MSGVGTDDNMYTIFDTARVFMIVILPKRVSILADQLSKILLIFSIFSFDYSDNDGIASVKMVKNLNLSPYTGNNIYRSISEHFYNLLNTTRFNLINDVSGIVVNKINPNLHFTYNKYVSDYNIKRGFKLINSSYITRDTVNENSNYTIFISFFYGPSKKVDIAAKNIVDSRLYKL